MSRRALTEGARALGMELDPWQVELFLAYMKLLEEGGKRANLTAIKGADIVPLHFLDSLAGAVFLPQEAGLKLLDVGSGAGFPGVPLKICRPDLNLHILDSSEKRLSFVAGLVETLGLKGVELFHGRAEEYGQRPGYRASYPWVTARALAPLTVLLELCLPFCFKGGAFFAYKGPDVSLELQESLWALTVLGGRLVRDHPLALPGNGAMRRLLLFGKTADTPERYPRRPGIPAKRPLLRRGEGH